LEEAPAEDRDGERIADGIAAVVSTRGDAFESSKRGGQVLRQAFMARKRGRGEGLTQSANGERKRGRQNSGAAAAG